MVNARITWLKTQRAVIELRVHLAYISWCLGDQLESKKCNFFLRCQRRNIAYTDVLKYDFISTTIPRPI